MTVRVALLAAVLILAAAAGVAASLESVKGVVLWGVVSSNCGLTLTIRAASVSVLDPPCTLTGLAGIEGVYVYNGTVYIETSHGVIHLDPSTCRAAVAPGIPRGACRAEAGGTGLPLHNGLADYTSIRLGAATLNLPVDTEWYCVDAGHAVLLRRLEGKVQLYQAEGRAYRVVGEALAATALGVVWDGQAYALGFIPLQASAAVVQLIRPGNTTTLGVYQGVLLNASSGDALLPTLVVINAERRVAEQRLYEVSGGTLRSVKLGVVHTLPEPAGFGVCGSRTAIWLTKTKLLATIGAAVDTTTPRSEPIGVTSSCEPVVKLGSTTLLYPGVGIVSTPLPVERGLASLNGLLILASRHATIVYKPGSKPLIYNRGADAAAALLYPWGLALNGVAVDKAGRVYPAETSTCIVHGWSATATREGGSTLILALGPRGPRCAKLPFKPYMVRGLVHDGRHAWLLAVLEQPSGGNVLAAIQLDQLPPCKPLNPATRANKTATRAQGSAGAANPGEPSGTSEAGVEAGAATRTPRATTGEASTQTRGALAGSERVTSSSTGLNEPATTRGETPEAKIMAPGAEARAPLLLAAAAVLAAILVFLAKRRS